MCKKVRGPEGTRAREGGERGQEGKREARGHKRARGRVGSTETLENVEGGKGWCRGGDRLS